MLEVLVTEVKVVSQNINLILALGNKNMQQRHWNKVFALLDGTPPTSLRSFNFQQLLSDNVDQHFEKIEEISA